MSVGIAVLRSKDRRYLEHSLAITRNQHLLIKLRALGQVCLLSKVIGDLENSTPTFSSSSKQLRAIDPFEVALEQIFGKQDFHTT